MRRTRNILIIFSISTLIKVISANQHDETDNHRNETDTFDAEEDNYYGSLAAVNSERYRRLIPYATFYSVPPNYYNHLKSAFPADIDRNPNTQQSNRIINLLPAEKTVYAYQQSNNKYVPPSTAYQQQQQQLIKANNNVNYFYKNPRFYEPSLSQQKFQTVDASSDGWQPKFIPSPPVLDPIAHTSSEPTDYLDFRYSSGLQRQQQQTTKTPIFTTAKSLSASVVSSTVPPQNYDSTTAEPPSLVNVSPTDHRLEQLQQQRPTPALQQYHDSVFPPQYLPSINFIPSSLTTKTKNTFIPAERTTKKTLTTMTITKSQEIEIGRQQQTTKHGQQPKQFTTKLLEPVRPLYFPAPSVHPVDQPLSSAIVLDQQREDYDAINGYALNKQLPDRITPSNIKDSIRTLSYLLDLLQKADSITQSRHPIYSDAVLETYKLPNLQQLDGNNQILSDQHHHQQHHSSYNDYNNAFAHDVAPVKDHHQYTSPNSLLYDDHDSDNHHETSSGEDLDDSTPGKAGLDYPVYSVIPKTEFSCKSQRYKGFFADPETKCQVWHYCDLNGGKASFLCPNGTIFSQAALTCDWWFNVKCSTTSQLYVLNERLYKYIIPMRPSFPEDFSGPLVDRYLTEKFKEIESKRTSRFPNNSTAIAIEQLQQQQQHQRLNDSWTLNDEKDVTTPLSIASTPTNDDDEQSRT